MSDHVSPGGRRLRNGTPTTRVWYRLPTPLVEWLADEAEARGVADTVLLVRALEELRRNLPPVPASGTSTADLLDEATRALDTLG